MTLRRCAWLALVLAGCPGPKPAGGGGGTAGGGTAGGGGGGAATPDAAEATEEQKVAAIEKAMNQLAPVANQCWASGAADDYQLAGEVTLQIAPHGDGARVAVTRDTTGDKVLTSCLQTVASAYAWPAELSGEVIELPFAFTAPKGQFVIDRRLVPIVGQAGVGVAVLVDAKNTGNAAASMFELTFKPSATLGLTRTERHEVWAIVAGGGTMGGAPTGRSVVIGGATSIREGDVIDVPKRAYRDFSAGASGMSAVVVVVPGGPEGVARGGAMPGERIYGAVTDKAPVGPRKVKPTSYGGGGRQVALYLDPAAGATKDISAARAELGAGLDIPSHNHAGETELLYVIAGDGTMVVDGVTLPVGASSVIQIPKAVRHQAKVGAALTALQFYTPAGPEQRFKARPK